MKSGWYGPVHITEWRDKLHEVADMLRTRNFSIVYKFYSTKYGPVRYVGRSNDPFSRESAHLSKISIFDIHEDLGGRIAWVKFKVIRGRGRVREAFEEECRIYHQEEPDLNKKHPEKPPNARYKCPYCRF